MTEIKNILDMRNFGGKKVCQYLINCEIYPIEMEIMINTNTNF